MPINTHVARIGLIRVDPLGNIVSKNDTIKTVLNSSEEHRILEDANIPNSMGNPTIEDYLEAEGSDDFILGHISQNLIVTYSAADINAA